MVVAKAAPATPIFGAPRLPNINTQFNTALHKTPIKLAYIGIDGCPVLLSAEERHWLKLTNIVLIATILKYCEPNCITSISFDNIPIILWGKTKAAKPNIIVAINPIVISIPNIFFMSLTFFLPQNWAINILAPAFIPIIHKVNIKKYWFANPTAAIGVSPNLPIMRLSTRFNDVVIKFCNAIGIANVSIAFKNTLSSKIFPIFLTFHNFLLKK